VTDLLVSSSPFETFRLISDTNHLAIELRQFANWVLWKHTINRDGKRIKPPCCADTYHHRYHWDKDGDGAKVTYLDGLYQRRFNRALAYLFNNRAHYDGPGFVLRRPYDQNCALTCGDLDWKKTGQPTAFQIAVMNACIGRTYVEFSPSGYGVHIWFRGYVANRKRPEVEIYSHSRFLTITFDPLPGCNVPFAEWATLVPVLPRELLAIVAQTKPSSVSSRVGNMPTGGCEIDACDEWVQYPPEPLRPEDEDLCWRAANAENGEKFKWFWSDEWQQQYVDDGRVDQSRADLALFNILAWHTIYDPNSIEQVIRIFHASELGKRGKAFDAQYLRRTINRAFDRKLPHISLTFIDGIPVVGGA
jgi:primase-polymerase (primpol)-like protein